MHLAFNQANLDFLQGVFAKRQAKKWHAPGLPLAKFVLSHKGIYYKSESELACPWLTTWRILAVSRKYSLKARQRSGMPLACNLVNSVFLLGVFPNSPTAKWRGPDLQPGEFGISTRSIQ